VTLSVRRNNNGGSIPDTDLLGKMMIIVGEGSSEWSEYACMILRATDVLAVESDVLISIVLLFFVQLVKDPSAVIGKLSGDWTSRIWIVTTLVPNSSDGIVAYRGGSSC
jgi:hypothetical protein